MIQARKARQKNKPHKMRPKFLIIVDIYMIAKYIFHKV